MGPLSRSRTERERVQQKLRHGDAGLWAAIFLFAAAIVIAVWATTRLSSPTESFTGYLLATLITLVARTLHRRALHGERIGAQWLDVAWLGSFWLLMSAGLVVVVNGRLPFLGHALERDPQSNVATDLGNAVLGGLIVGAMLILLELAHRRRESRVEDVRRSDSERSDMLLFLGLERDLRLVDLSDRDLSWFSLRQRDIAGARLRRTCLFRTNLEKCDLTRAEFDDADLTNIFLAEATANRAIFKRATLDHGHLQWISLKDADLWGASMREVKLEGADLSGADLRATDLRGTSLSQVKLDGARYSDDTLFPTDFDPMQAGMTRDDSTPSTYSVTPTGRSICSSDHEPDRIAWIAEQAAAAEEFAGRLRTRVAEHRAQAM